jgi:Tfp pilus assembly protein PilF
MKNILKVSLITSLFFIISCASTDSKEKASALHQAQLHQEIGMGYLKGKNYPAALKQLMTANKLAPNNPEILNNLAIAYHYRGRTDVAEKVLRKSLSLSKNYTEARNNLARILIENKKYSQAIKHLLIAREDLTYQHPEKVHANLAETYFHLGDYENANKEADLALQVNRHMCLALIYKVKTLYVLKKFGPSADLADRTELTCPGDQVPELVYLSGMSYYQQGFSGKAKSRFHKLKEKYPHNDFTKKAKMALANMGSN